MLFSVAVAAQEDVSNQLENIDFRVDSEQNAQIIVQLANPRVAVDVQKAQEGLSIELINTNVVDDKIYLLDVKDFATNVESIEVFRKEPSTLLVASIEGEYSYDYTLNGNYLEVIVKKPSKDEKPKQKSILEGEGKKISINFQDIPVRNVLQLIADYNDFNLVVSDSVSGNLTLRLDGVPWQQVLDIILQVKGLDKRVEGNVVLVAPKEELDLREKQLLEKS
ncbi:secretin and TonB N-terminal domain-containing protein, partial [Vibrio nereis]